MLRVSAELLVDEVSGSFGYPVIDEWDGGVGRGSDLEFVLVRIGILSGHAAPEWWNRQTRGIQNPVPVMGVWVQVPPPVLTVKGLTSNWRESFFAFLEPRLPSMREIQSELLWTGNARDARDARGLIGGGIAAVIDLAYEELPAQLPRQLVYCRFPIVDGAGNDPSLLRLALLTTVELLRSGTPAIVACSAGMSRSPAIAICALAVHVD